MQPDGRHACEQAARYAYGARVFGPDHMSVVASAASLAKCGICLEM